MAIDLLFTNHNKFCSWQFQLYFQAIEPPHAEAISSAIDLLYKVSILEDLSFVSRLNMNRTRVTGRSDLLGWFLSI